MKRKVWQGAQLSGEAYLDNPRMGLFPLGHPVERDIYEAFITGRKSRQMQPLKNSQRLRLVLEQAQKVLPAVRSNFEVGTSKNWDEDVWARGAWAWYKPGQMTSLLAESSRAEGRLHFAGEHTSAWPGWMQGAFDSGNRVAREIHQS